MDIKVLSTKFSASGQISLEDVSTIAEKGYKSILCNRPDGEDLTAPQSQAISDAVKEAGMVFSYVPIPSHGFDAIVLRQFETELRALPEPVFGYCRSGARTAMAWQMSSSSL